MLSVLLTDWKHDTNLSLPFSRDRLIEQLHREISTLKDELKYFKAEVNETSPSLLVTHERCLSDWHLSLGQSSALRKGGLQGKTGESQKVG